MLPIRTLLALIPTPLLGCGRPLTLCSFPASSFGFGCSRCAPFFSRRAFLDSSPAASHESDFPRRSGHLSWSNNPQLLVDGVQPGVGDRSLRVRVTCNTSSLGMPPLLTLESLLCFPPVRPRYPADAQHSPAAPYALDPHPVVHFEDPVCPFLFLGVGRQWIHRCLYPTSGQLSTFRHCTGFHVPPDVRLQFICALSSVG